MIESRAQRTLVKSPPELWAELSDPVPLARHLGEIGGEIRITRVEPERTVVWEGDRSGGTVELEPFGWGTKVTITLHRAADEGQEAAEPAAVAAPEPVAMPEPAAPPEPVATTAPPAVPVEHALAVEEPARPSEPAGQAQPAAPDSGAVLKAPSPRTSRMRRWLERRRARQISSEEPSAPSPAAPSAEPEPPASKPVASEPPLPEPEPPLPKPAPRAPAPPPVPAAVAPPPPNTGRADEQLAAVLDSLGSAHHRPFSRS